jgi:tetratricopeptide (TPR) repeat protein
MSETSPDPPRASSEASNADIAIAAGSLDQRGALLIGAVEKLQLSSTPPKLARPQQLYAVPNFTGRRRYITQLVHLLTREAGEHASARVAAIWGAPGVGKTALALEVAQRLKSSFPDGQLYVNLGGEVKQRDPQKVLAKFLRSFGLRAGAIPSNQEDREIYFQEILANRRILILLDNATNDAQVRPLLPIAPSCAVLVTSRRHIDGLEGASWHQLREMKLSEASRLLKKAAKQGGRQSRIKSDLADEIVQLCGCLPLALRIVGARISDATSPAIERLMNRLRDERHRLHELRVGSEEVRAAFQVSYDALTEKEQRAFRLLGIPRARSGFASWLAAALLDDDLQQVADVMDALTSAGLLETEREGIKEERYRFHDLLGLFANERLQEEGPDVQHASLVRGLQACVALSKLGRDLLEPARVLSSGESSPARWKVRDPSILQVVQQDPYGWYTEERTALVTAVERAMDAEEWELAWELATTLPPFFGLQGFWGDWERIQRLALRAAERLDDPRKEATTLRGYGDLFRQQGQLEKAQAAYEQSRETYRKLGERHGEAELIRCIGGLRRQQGQWKQALSLLEQALPVFRELGDRRSEALTIRHMGVAMRNDGRWGEALDCFNRCLPVFGEIGDRRSEAYTLRHIGVVYRNRGRWEEALDCFSEALPMFQEIGDRRGEATVLTGRGDVYRERGQWKEALSSLEEALLIRRKLGDHRWAAATLRMIGVVYHLQRKSDEALARYRSCLEIFRQAHDECWEAYTLVNLGEVYGELEQLDEGLSYLDEALSLLRRLDNSLWVAKALKSRGEVLAKVRAGHRESPEADWREALEIFRQLGAPEAEQVENLLLSAVPE